MLLTAKFDNHTEPVFLWKPIATSGVGGGSVHVVYSQFQYKTESVFLRKPIATIVCVCVYWGWVSACCSQSSSRTEQNQLFCSGTELY